MAKKPNSKKGKGKGKGKGKDNNNKKPTSSTYSNVQYTTNISESRLETSIDNSMRLFGIPHQFIAHNDPRIGEKSNLGRCFAERIIMEAPIVCFQPGVSDFLPGKSDKKKKKMLNEIMEAATTNSSLNSIFGKLGNDKEDDTLMYYSHKEKYSDMMAKVNVLCKMMAVFLGIQDTKVPWAAGNATFGTYDWRYYTAKSQYNNVTTEKAKDSKGSIGAFIKDSMVAAGKSIMEDTKWIRFYVDSSSSYGSSYSIRNARSDRWISC